MTRVVSVPILIKYHARQKDDEFLSFESNEQLKKKYNDRQTIAWSIQCTNLLS